MESPPIWTRSSLNMQLHIIKIIHYNITHYTTHIVTFNRGSTLTQYSHYWNECLSLQTEPRVGKCQGELRLEWSSGVRGDEVSCSDILTSVTLNVPIMIFKHWICRAVDTFTLYEAIFAFRLIFRYGKEVVDIFHLQYRLLHPKDFQQLPRVQRKCKKYGMPQGFACHP